MTDEAALGEAGPDKTAGKSDSIAVIEVVVSYSTCREMGQTATEGMPKVVRLAQQPSDSSALKKNHQILSKR